MNTMQLPRIRAYHPRIGVRQGSEVRTITGNLPDWQLDKDYLKSLKKASGAHTAGELVAALESGLDDGFDSHLEGASDIPMGTELDWDDVI